MVTWIIDRNSNTTNVCIANCKFCNFYRRPGHAESYTTTIEEYKQKIDELFALGGDQLLLQGGHHPDLGLDFYCKLFSELKSIYPNLKLHALGPPEIAHIAKLDQASHREVLQALKESAIAHVQALMGLPLDLKFLKKNSSAPVLIQSPAPVIFSQALILDKADAGPSGIKPRRSERIRKKSHR